MDTEAAPRRYGLPSDYLDEFFNIDRAKEVTALYPDHCLVYGSQIGPFAWNLFLTPP